MTTDTATTAQCTCEYPGILCPACVACAKDHPITVSLPVQPRPFVCELKACGRSLQDGDWRKAWTGHWVCGACYDELFSHH